MVGIHAEFQWQRGTAERWLEWDFILKAGEPGLETNTGKFKIGNGFSPWVDLPYYLDENGIAVLVEDLLAELGGGTFDPRVGDLNDLSTTTKANLVSAINEMNLPGVPYRTLYNNAKAG